MPNPDKMLATIRRASTLCRATPGRRGSIIELTEVDEVMVVGDLHGHIHTFARALKKAALDQHPKRHLVLQELVHDPRVNPDEGGVDFSHRLVDVVSALKCQYPSRVHVLLGNHELSELTGRSIGKNGVYLNVLFRKGIEASYGTRADEFSQAYKELFAALPVAIKCQNRVMLCHTLPDERALETLDLAVLEASVWPEESMKRGGTIYSMTWGRDTNPEHVDRLAEILDAELFITGHHPCDEGYRVANHRHLILDATDPYPGYCLFNAEQEATLDGLIRGVGLLTEG